MHVSYIAIIVAFLLVNTIAASVHIDRAGLKIRKRGLRRRNSILPDIVLPSITTQQQQQQPARAQSVPATYAYPAGYPAYYQPSTANTAVYSPPVAQAAAPVAQSPPAAAAAAAPAPATTVAQPVQLLAPPPAKKEDDDDEEEEDEDEPDEEDFDADDLVTK